MAGDLVRIDWGDGTEEEVPIGAPRRHAYAQPGSYTVLTKTLDGRTVGRTLVVVKGRDPAAHVYSGADDPWQVLLWLDEPDDGTLYEIEWGDGSAPEKLPGQRRVPPHPRVPHLYSGVATYTVTVTDTRSRRSIRREVAVGDLGVLLTWDAPRRPRAEVLWCKTGARWEVDWADGITVDGAVPASGRVNVSAPQDIDPGEHAFEMREYVNGAVRRRVTRRYMVPTQWDWSLGVRVQWRDLEGPDPEGYQTVGVTPAHPMRTSCTVDWGDGTEPAVIPVSDPPGSAVHLYDLQVMPAAGWRLRVAEATDVDAPREFNRRVCAPRLVTQPLMTAGDAGAVDLNVAGADQEWNDDWYGVSWGDGGSYDVGAVGWWYPAHHRYTREGTYTILVDGPGMATAVAREVVVAMYPGPTLTVVEERDKNGDVSDPERRTVRVAVDNTASGGPCTVYMGDGTIYRRAEQDSFTHKYAPPATRVVEGYWVIVTSDADPTAQARALVEVPFGQEQTLFYQLGQDTEADPYRARLTVTERTPGKEAYVDWGGGGTQEVVPPDGVAAHTYEADDTYFPEVGYTDGSESHAETLTIPFT